MKVQAFTPSACVQPTELLHAFAIVAESHQQEAILAELYGQFIKGHPIVLMCGDTRIACTNDIPPATPGPSPN